MPSCSSCQTENADGARFCIEYGHPVAEVCAACQAENPPQAKFCGQCGNPLGSASPSPAPSAPEAERRQLTVMFCDVVGSTALSEELDAEDFRALVQTYQRAAAKAIAPFDGYMAQYYGDGLLIYFGYPIAHEDEAVRAVNAGLAIVSAMASLSRPLAVRIGVHTGNVVAGEIGTGERREQLAIGQTPNLAAHLQGLAEPNTVVVSEATYRLAEGFFNFEPLGPKALKGTSAPVLVYRALEESGVHGRFELTVRRGLSPLVGRRAELDLLAEKLRSSFGGEGQAVLVTGGAGVGKSRLVHSFREELRTERSDWWVYRCTPYTQNTSFYPIIEMLHEQLRLEADDTPAEKIAKLEDRCDAFGLSREEIVPLLAELISLPLDGRYPPLNLSPQLFKEAALAFFVSFILDRAAELPVVFFMEDLHWVDPSTMEFLSLMLDGASNARIMIVFTTRPEFECPWTARPDFTTLELGRLESNQIAELVGELTGGHTLSPELLAHIQEKTDGVPLYVEEMTKSVLESDFVILRGSQYEIAEGHSLVGIPTTLRDALTARLDRLGSAKAAAQLGSAVGREFSFDLMAAVSLQDETTLRRDIDRLVEAELLYERVEGFHTTYIFKHALVQDAAHLSLLRSQRQKIHERIASVLEDKFPDVVETRPELLAYHHEEAGTFTEAAQFLTLAGRRTAQRSAYAESVSHCRKGLELLEVLPRTPDHLEQELAIRSTLGVGLIVTRGYQAEDVAENSARSQEACEELGDTPHLVPSLYGLWVYHLLRGHGEEAFELAENIRRAGADSDAFRLIGCSAIGTTMLYAGRFEESRQHFEAAMAIYGPELQAELAPNFGEDSGLLPNCYHWWCLWILGESEAALAHKESAMRVIEELASPYVLAFGLLFEMILWHALLNTQKVREISERLVEVTREQRYILLETVGNIGDGWSLCQEGKVDEGIDLMQGALEVHAAIGTRLPHSYWRTYLIDALRAAGRTREGLECVDEALRLTETQLDKFYDAELHRLRGELLAQAGKPDEAEAAYQRSLEIARAMGANALERRTLESLDRLVETNGRSAPPTA